MYEVMNDLKKDHYEALEMEVVILGQEDIILTSYEYPGEEDDL